MKSTIILTCLLVFVSQISSANQHDNKKRPTPDISALATELNLDQTKSERLEHMVQSHRQSMKQLHQQKQQAREQMHEMRDQHRQQLLTILDHQQLYQFETYMRQFRPRGKSQKVSD